MKPGKRARRLTSSPEDPTNRISLNTDRSQGRLKDGLRGKDKRQEALQDNRRGAYDSAGIALAPDTSIPTARERAQPGAGMQGDPVPIRKSDLPEGLRRQRKGPYDRNRGRR